MGELASTRYLHRIEDMHLARPLTSSAAVSERSFDEFAPLLESRSVLVPAQFRNNAAIVGAELVAV